LTKISDEISRNPVSGKVKRVGSLTVRARKAADTVSGGIAVAARHGAAPTGLSGVLGRLSGTARRLHQAHKKTAEVRSSASDQSATRRNKWL